MMICMYYVCTMYMYNAVSYVYSIIMLCIIRSIYVIISAVAPCSHTCSAKAHVCISLAVKQPIGNIVSFQILQITLVLEILWEQRFAFAEPLQHLPRLIPLYLERNHDIGLKLLRSRGFDDYDIVTIRACRTHRILIRFYLSAAGRTDIHAILCPCRPASPLLIFPTKILLSLMPLFLLILPERLDVIFVLTALAGELLRLR